MVCALQVIPEERIRHRVHVRRLLVVGRAAVAAFGVFVEPRVRVAHFVHPRRHLARLHRADAVVAGRGIEEDRRIVLALRDILVRRERLDERPVLAACPDRRIRRSTTRRPTDGVALHVEQRHFADDRAEQLRILVSMLPISRPPLLPPSAPRCARDVYAALDEILARPPRNPRRRAGDSRAAPPVPARAVFAAAADVRDDVDAAALEPARPTLPL